MHISVSSRAAITRCAPPALILVLLATALCLLGPTTARAQGGALIITEIHCDPRELSDENGEWIEIYNIGNTTIDLRGWSLEDSHNDAHQIRSSTPLLVEPDTYAVLARRAEILQGMGVNVLYAYGDDFVLDDIQDEVLLVAEDGVISDGLGYDRSEDWPSTYGHAMAWKGSGNRRQARNWADAQYESFTGDFGSPGLENSDVPIGAPEPYQEEEPQRTRHSRIYAELMYGDLANDAGVRIQPASDGPPADKENEAWVARFGARVQVSNSVGFLMEVPYAVGSYAVQKEQPSQQPVWEEANDSTLGNIYLGTVFNLGGSEMEVEAGIHMPTASDSVTVDQKVASIVGAATDWVTGAESFAQDAVPVSLYLRHNDIFPWILVLGGEAALHVWFPLDDREDAVAFFQYGAWGGMDIGLLRGGLGLYGRYQTPGPDDELDNDFIHEGRLFAEARLGPFRPGIEYRRGISTELTDIFDATYVARLAIDLP